MKQESNFSFDYRLVKLALAGIRIINHQTRDIVSSFKGPRYLPTSFLGWLRNEINAQNLSIFLFRRDGSLFHTRSLGDSFNWNINYVKNTLQDKWHDKNKLVGPIRHSFKQFEKVGSIIGYFAIYRDTKFSHEENEIIYELFEFYGDYLYEKWNHFLNLEKQIVIENLVKLVKSEPKSGSVISNLLHKIQSRLYAAYILYFTVFEEKLFVEYSRKPFYKGMRTKFYRSPRSFEINVELHNVIKKGHSSIIETKLLNDLISSLFKHDYTLDDNSFSIITPITHGPTCIGLSIIVFPYNYRYSTRLAIDLIESCFETVRKQVNHLYQRRSRAMIINPIFKHNDTRVNDEDIFVIMPFNESWSDRIWKRILRPLIEEMSLKPFRSDDLYGRDIMEDIWKSICTSRIVIADITGRNPNVFYELGLAHTLGKDFILLTQNENDIPFDLNRYRHIIYSDNLDGYDKLRNELKSTITEILS